MREIIFRGKERTGILNHAWLVGALDNINEESPKIIGPDRYGNPMFVDVAPETVGQFTGLTDKNGKRIFEGDIVEFYFFDKTRRNGELVEVKNTKTMLIVWAEQSFHMKELFRNYRLDKELGIITEIIYEYRGDRRQGVYQTNECYFVEVIGNAHDNPELLEVET